MLPPPQPELLPLRARDEFRQTFPPCLSHRGGDNDRRGGLNLGDGTLPLVDPLGDDCSVSSSVSYSSDSSASSLGYSSPFPLPPPVVRRIAKRPGRRCSQGQRLRRKARFNKQYLPQAIARVQKMDSFVNEEDWLESCFQRLLLRWPSHLDARNLVPHALELFCGTGVVSKTTAQFLGLKSTRLDSDRAWDPELCCDVLDWDPVDFVLFLLGNQEYVSILWSSPPCRFLSMCNFLPGRFEPSIENLALSVLVVNRTTSPMKFFDRVARHLGKNFVAVMENPAESLLAHLPHVQHLWKTMVNYCCFGFPYKK